MPPTFAAENQLTTAVAGLANATVGMRIVPKAATTQVTVALGKYLPAAQVRVTDGRGSTVE